MEEVNQFFVRMQDYSDDGVLDSFSRSPDNSTEEVRCYKSSYYDGRPFVVVKP